MLFLRGNGKQPSLDLSLISLLVDLPEQQNFVSQFYLTVLIFWIGRLDMKKLMGPGFRITFLSQ